MALDPNIILQASKIGGIDPGALLEQRAQVQLRNLGLAKAQREEAAAQARLATLKDVGAKAASGDLTGAKTTALQSGDFDLAGHLDTMTTAQRQAAFTKAQAGAAVLQGAAARPPAERAAVIAAAAPTLASQGYTPEDIAKLGSDLSDAGIAGNVSAAMTLTQQLEQANKKAELAQRAADNAASRDFTRGNAFISAGILPPSVGGNGAPTGVVPATAPTRFGWTPRASAGGDNTDAAVDGKIGGMSKALGIDPTTPFPAGMTPMQIAQALTISEGGKGSLADRNNNPGNLTDGKGGYRRFPTKQAGLDAAAAQVRRNLARGQNTIQTMVEGLPVGGRRNAAPSSNGLPPGYSVIPGGKLDKQADAEKPPSGYRWKADGSLEPIPGGPGDKQGRQANLKPPPVKAVDGYNNNRTALRKLDQAVAAITAYPDAVGFLKGMTPNAISSRTDPKGVSARALIADIGSLKIHDRSGAAVTAAETPRLIPFIPQVGDNAETVKTKLANFQTELQSMQADIEDSYSEAQGYKFPTYRSQPSRPQGTINAPQGAVPVMTPAQAAKAPKGTRFKTTDGRIMVRQ